ncbi:MAG: cytochrome c biogenesis factor [Sphingomonadaceae bacterium]
MIWWPFLLLAAAVFLIAALVLRLPRSGYALFGAALLFGLSGYALQGSPNEPSSPRTAQERDASTGGLFVDARRRFFDPEALPSRYIVTADAFARKGDFQDAANFAENAVSENPRDAEGWVALGNALTQHAEGQLTPAALYAYGKAQALAPDNAAAGYFVGLAMLRAGQPLETRKIWADALAAAPKDAPWRAELAARIGRLDSMLEQQPGS